ACLSSADFLPSFPKGSTYIFTTEVPQQNNPGGGWPATKNVNGQVIDLAVDSKVVNDSRYKNQIDYSLKSIPSISITTDIKNLFDPTTGIYVNAEGHGEEWERECSVELLNPDGSPGFNVNAGLRIRGGWSRHDDFPKHSLRLFFNSQYGNSKLEFPLFDDEGASKYDKIDLRTAQNYGWSNNQGEHNTMCREVFSRDTQRDMGQPYSRSRYYHLYLNGMYWGLYQTQERTEANFASTYLGGQDTDYDVAKVNTEGYSYVIEATDGTLDSWRNIWNLTTAGYSSNAAFFRLEGKDSFGEKVDGNPVLVDIDNLIDYMLVIFYTGNFDSPTSSFGGNKGCNNFFAIYNKTTKDQGFTFYAHDSEHSLMSDVIPPGTGLTEDRVNLARRTDGSNMDVNRFEVFHPQWLHEKLTVNEEYRLRFADRAYNYLRPGNVLSPEACTERFNTRAAQIEDAIIAESARWGDAKTGSWAYTKDDNWLPEINKVRTAFFPYRSNILVGQLELAGILPSVDPPDIISNGTTVYAENTSFTSSALVSFQNPNGKGAVYYTLDNTDPRLVGGGISPSAILWQAGNNVNMNYSARVNCRIYSNGEWSAMNFTTFLKTDEDYSALKVTELAYHPEDVINGTDTVFGTSLEYIEFKNTGDKPLNISGMMLDSAVHCTFPANTVLGPQQYYVAASKPGAFTEFFGYPPSANFSGNFSNSGEYVLLTDPFGNPVISFTYSDKSPWPVEADGSGYTLNSTLNNPVGDPNIYTYWRASHYKRGTPFSYDEYPNSIENKLSDEFELSLYPNPASEFVSIDIKSENQEEEFRIKIYSYAGVLLYDKVFENETTINLRENGIVPGMYLLKIENSRHTETRKLIVN
ncbi:MAG: CotH kinase family protein, partial [Bacteroidales bacterium]|nr:CotH kinase family protein [Bacteroidales bacterium]